VGDGVVCIPVSKKGRKRINGCELVIVVLIAEL
jgi:hypothetical protein